MTKYENSVAIKNFQEYLKIPSVQPNVDYGKILPYLNKSSSDTLVHNDSKIK